MRRRADRLGADRRRTRAGCLELAAELLGRALPGGFGEAWDAALFKAFAALLRAFEGRMFSAADVARPKPAPDLFLHAAASLGAPPARCAVIEDTPTGVQAAVAAGMAVFGYAAGAHSSAEALAAGGAVVFRHMRALPALLRA